MSIHHDEDAHKIAALRRKLLKWYLLHRRDLPWRRSRDPYEIWVSEIMLQQTRVAVVVERYREFLLRFPTLASLAAADEQDVLGAWSGLGYYRRARMLHKAAQFVTAQQRGKLPESAGALRTLPGIGAYTAAAIASIAHGECVAVVDGNVERVLCRLEGWDGVGHKTGGPLRRRIEALAARLVDPVHPGDFNQAVMELGATVCLPRNPSCSLCPVSRECTTRGEHRTAPRPAIVSREVAHALVLRTTRDKKNGASPREILLEQRPPELSVMPGMWELPALSHAGVPESELHMTVRHAIMQVNYVVRIRRLIEKDVDDLTIYGGHRRWVRVEEAAQMALTGLTRKVLKRSKLLPEASSAAAQK